MDMNGNIYIIDSDLARVTKWTPGSTSGILVAGGSAYIDYNSGNVDNMDGSSGMFIDPQTMIIWIADTNNHRIVKWINSSSATTVCGSYGSQSNQFESPGGLFVDIDNGNILYVADTYNHRIQMWLPGSKSGITVAGITDYYGTRLDQLWIPMTLIIDTNSNMFIVDFGNSRILKWTVGASSGVIIAGRNPMGGVLPSELDYPSSISFNSNGSLFVSDTENNRIQMFSISCRNEYLIQLLFIFIYFVFKHQ
jgi:DNA-binding beta-propeller fold protein YncE